MALRSGRVGIHPSQVDPITGMLINTPTPGSMSFEDLSDAQITDPEVGQTLIYNGTGWENETPSVTPTTLSALQDVQITDPEDGAYLVYDAENNKWINSETPPAPVVPEGSTVTPTDDIQTWLACASITDKTYTTLNEVLADSTTLLALMSNNNAADYLLIVVFVVLDAEGVFGQIYLATQLAIVGIGDKWAIARGVKRENPSILPLFRGSEGCGFNGTVGQSRQLLLVCNVK